MDQDLAGRARQDVRGEAPTRSFLARITKETALVETVVVFVREHLKPALLYNARHEVKPSAIRRLALKAFCALVGVLLVALMAPLVTMSAFDLGQSFARLDAYGVAFGLSHENLWLGPAARNPLLLSNTAPGFTHLFLGTTRPLDLWIARLSAQLVLGRLEESDYFDAVDSNDRSNLALTVIGLQPRFLDGLELGIARAYMYRPDETGGFGAFSDLEVFVPSGRTNFPGNELASLFARWVFPASRAEIFAEWGRDDRWAAAADAQAHHAARRRAALPALRCRWTAATSRASPRPRAPPRPPVRACATARPR